MPTAVEDLKEVLFDVNALSMAGSVMEWDHQTMMPKGGAEARAEHLAILSRMIHDTLTSDKTGKLIEKAKAEAEGDDAALVRVAEREFNNQIKIPAQLVSKKAKLSAQAHELWVGARARNDFKSFEPVLAEMFDIARQEAEYLGYQEHIYDALIDLYEEGATHQLAKGMFDTIKGPLSDLIKRISALPEVDDSFLTGDWPVADQRTFTEMLAKSIGFDFDRGRQDTAAHPFCTNFSVNDVRLTTRFLPNITSAIFGTLHEAGHGMYEQGSPEKWDRTPLAGGVSLGVHESQSRTWENLVGRNPAFWAHFYPSLQQQFPALQSKSLDEFVRAVNKVKPSFIRVEADEITYNLHIVVRFELESAILAGELAVSDLPEAWNEKYRSYLGIVPQTDADGCLQDVHWSGALIGYFPTYSMGNLLSYQFWSAMAKDIPNQDELISKGQFKPILGWLQEKIYSKGSRYKPQELVQMVTGGPMAADKYLTGIIKKYETIYGL